MQNIAQSFYKKLSLASRMIRQLSFNDYFVTGQNFPLWFALMQRCDFFSNGEMFGFVFKEELKEVYPISFNGHPLYMLTTLLCDSN